MHLYCILTYVILSFCCLTTYAQDLKFNTLTKEGVLDRQSILCITQDEEGRIIFGGQNQLFYFDSYHIERLNIAEYVEKNMLYIEHILAYKDNKLFIGSPKQLVIYDTFRKELLQNGKGIWHINIPVLKLEKFNEQVFVLSTNGLYILVETQNSYKLIRKLKIDNPKNLEHIVDDKYFITNHKGIYEISINNNNNVQYIRDLKTPTSLEPTTTLIDHSTLWVGTRNKGIFKYDLLKKVWTNNTQYNSNLLSDNIRKITKDDKGNIWIGTLRGLSILHPNEKIFNNYRHESTDKQSLSQNSIYAIYHDNQKNTWIGTYFGGLNHVNKKPYNINTYTASLANKSKINSEIISSVAESSNHIWIATEEEGIAKMDKITKEITNLPNLTKSNLIKDIFIQNDILYIAQIGDGYSIYDIKTNAIKHYDIHNGNMKYLNDVNRIYVDDTKNIYLSTAKGILMTNAHHPTQFVNILPSSSLPFTDVQKDDKQQLYFLINGKLYFKSFNDHILRPYPHTANLDLRSFFIDKNTFWLVSTNEILKLNADKSITKVHRFKNSSHAKIIAHQHKLWIARNEGIFCYDLATQTLNLITQQDGLLVKNLEYSRLFLTEDKQLFVPSLNGLMSFFPEKVAFNDRIPGIIYQDFIGVDDHAITSNRIQKLNANKYAITLKYNENNFTVQFASDNLSKPLKNKFKYQLEGFESMWNETSIPSAKYSNLNPGKYTLHILSSNNDNLWTKTPLIIEIDINAPFWMTWWAFLLYAIAILIVLHLGIKFIVEREVLINSEKEHQKKINFFTQISHEIRTPLTLITAPIDEILEATKKDHETANKVHRLKKNANKLLTIVNELLDFKKIDAGKEILHPTAIEVKPYLEEMFYLFSDLAVNKQLNFFIKDLNENVILEIDTHQFDKVIYNLLSNAIKYTPEKGTVFLNTRNEHGKFSIEIWDSGIGIQKDNEFKIFEEYYRDSNAQDSIGTGIGLALTKKIVEQHKGKISCSTEIVDNIPFTCFKIELSAFNKLNTSKQASVEHKNIETREADDKDLLLIVEDNIELHEVIENIFKEKFTILKAYDGIQGLKLAQDYLPSLIISDVMMPNMDGVQLCEAIKSDEQTAHIPIVMLTANTNEETQVKSLKYGSNVYLFKPFNPNILNLTVINLLNLTHAKRQQFNIEKKELTLSEVDLKFLNKLEKVIDDNILNEDFGVEYLSKELGMSTPILYKKIKAITNMSVNNFVKTYRFKKAISLMKSGYNISEIAYAVGFSDRKYFSKEFKKIYGVNPSEYEDKA